MTQIGTRRCEGGCDWIDGAHRFSLRFAKRLLVVTLFALAVPHAAAQGRSVRGKVMDQAGEPLKGAVVKIKDAHTLHIRSYITQADGEYRFHGLHPDLDYELKAKYRGYTSKVRTLNWYDSRTEAQIDFKLRLREDARASLNAVLTRSAMGPCKPLPATRGR
jgi:hypothetical protein